MGGQQAVRVYVDTLSVSIYLYTVNGKDIVKRLKDEGWKVTRQRGSHVLLRKGRLRTTVPVHGSKDLAIGTVKAIEKQTGIKLA